MMALAYIFEFLEDAFSSLEPIEYFSHFNLLNNKAYKVHMRILEATAAHIAFNRVMLKIKGVQKITNTD